LEIGKQYRRVGPVALIGAAILFLTWLATPVAHTQQSAGQPSQPAYVSQLPPPAPMLWSQIEVSVTPYLWLPLTSSTVRPGNTRIPSASTTVDPGTLISHLTWVPFVGAAELRSGDYGLVIDYIHAPG
jgi:hypothetical protein